MPFHKLKAILPNPQHPPLHVAFYPLATGAPALPPTLVEKTQMRQERNAALEQILSGEQAPPLLLEVPRSRYHTFLRFGRVGHNIFLSETSIWRVILQKDTNKSDMGATFLCNSGRVFGVSSKSSIFFPVEGSISPLGQSPLTAFSPSLQDAPPEEPCATSSGGDPLTVERVAGDPDPSPDTQMRRKCHICKGWYTQLHFFYCSLCPAQGSSCPTPSLPS